MLAGTFTVSQSGVTVDCVCYSNTEDFPVSKSVQNNVEYHTSGDNLCMMWFCHISVSYRVLKLAESCSVALLEGLTFVYNDNNKQIYFCQV